MNKKKKNIQELLEEALVQEGQPFKVPENWSWTTLNFVAEWGSGGTPKSTVPEYYDGDIPWLVIGDLNDDVVYKSARTITELGLKNSNAKCVEKGSILVAMYGSIGKLGIAGIDCTTNQAIAFTKKYYKNIEPKYLFFYLLSIRNKLLSLGKGGTQQNISQTVLKNIIIPIPPLDEQTRIAEKVERLLNKIEVARQLIEEAKETLELNKRNIIDATFLGMFSLNKRDRNQDFHGFIWEQKNLSDICEIRGGIQKTPKRKPIKDFYPYLRVANVYRDYLKLDEIEYFELTDVELEKWKLEPQDLLIIEGNGSIKEIGRSAIWNGEIENCVHQNHIIRCRPKYNVDSSFISLFLNSTFGRKQMMEKASSSSGLHTLSVKKLSSISIPLPSLDEQKCLVQKVNKLVHKVDQSLNEVENVNKIIQSLKQSILSKAYKGELSTNDPNDEPAIELLKSILQ